MSETPWSKAVQGVSAHGRRSWLARCRHWCGGEGFAGFEQRLELGQDSGPAVGDVWEQDAVGFEAVVGDGELDGFSDWLDKCGFHVIATERNVAEARSAEIEELMLLLDEVATAE
jgi:hypothetical protein